MVFGIGTDIFEVSRIRAVMESDIGFRDEVFTIGEIAYCERMKNRHQNYAAFYSVKEAFLKAIGTGWRMGIRFVDIDVYHDSLGKPYIRLYGKAEELAKKENISKIHVSLSHVKEMATAIVLLEKNEEKTEDRR